MKLKLKADCARGVFPLGDPSPGLPKKLKAGSFPWCGCRQSAVYDRAPFLSPALRSLHGHSGFSGSLYSSFGSADLPIPYPSLLSLSLSLFVDDEAYASHHHGNRKRKRSCSGLSFLFLFWLSSSPRPSAMWAEVCRNGRETQEYKPPKGKLGSKEGAQRAELPHIFHHIFLFTVQTPLFCQEPLLLPMPLLEPLYLHRRGKCRLHQM